jgi:hypothetical protein
VSTILPTLIVSSIDCVSQDHLSALYDQFAMGIWRRILTVLSIDTAACYRLAECLMVRYHIISSRSANVITGAAPSEKHATIVSRGNAQISTFSLFFTTSPSSRSSPSFSRNQVVLPPFALFTFSHALRSLDVQTVHVPLGEADGVCGLWQSNLVDISWDKTRIS